MVCEMRSFSLQSGPCWSRFLCSEVCSLGYLGQVDSSLSRRPICPIEDGWDPAQPQVNPGCQAVRCYLSANSLHRLSAASPFSQGCQSCQIVGCDQHSLVPSSPIPGQALHCYCQGPGFHDVRGFGPAPGPFETFPEATPLPPGFAQGRRSHLFLDNDFLVLENWLGELASPNQTYSGSFCMSDMLFRNHGV